MATKPTATPGIYACFAVHAMLRWGINLDYTKRRSWLRVTGERERERKGIRTPAW
jgi:hypothetical protein